MKIYKRLFFISLRLFLQVSQLFSNEISSLHYTNETEKNTTNIKILYILELVNNINNFGIQFLKNSKKLGGNEQPRSKREPIEKMNGSSICRLTNIVRKTLNLLEKKIKSNTSNKKNTKFMKLSSLARIRNSVSTLKINTKGIIYQ